MISRVGEPIPKPGDFPTDTQIEHEDERPGLQHKLKYEPVSDCIPDWKDEYFEEYIPSGKLKGKKAFITGGDSGIGKAVALLFSKEGADVAINYLSSEEKDASQTKEEIKAIGGKCYLVPGDIRYEKDCKEIIEKAIQDLGRIDILVNNAAEQHLSSKLEEITEEQLDSVFRTNIISMFFLTKFVLPQMEKGNTIINTTSIVAFRGSPSLVDYGATKGAIVGFTRCLAGQVADRGIRVNAVAPGPVWTALQPISRDEKGMEKFANESDSFIGRVAQPSEIATSYVFLASRDSSQFTGQTLHPNGGEIYNA
jgi:NAD(P)-dependent dehydrogenase (short-subunit alcohol dehydrogenase family)